MDVVQTTELAAAFVSRTIECERTYLASLWLDPIEGVNAACDAGLRGSDFLIPAHAVIFAYVCTCAERNLRTSVADCVLVAQSAGIQLGDYRPFPHTSGRLFLYDDVLLPHLDEIREGQCVFYAESVRDYADQRHEAQEAFQQYSQILSSESPHRRKAAHAA